MTSQAIFCLYGSIELVGFHANRGHFGVTAHTPVLFIHDDTMDAFKMIIARALLVHQLGQGMTL